MDPKNRLNEDVQRVHLNIEKVRGRGPRLKDERITLAHGAGGKASSALVEQVFLAAYSSAELRESEDAAILSVPQGNLAFSTDSYVVDPIIFPGGSIGDLAINGTVNDLAVSGARPEVISAAFILEEGLEIATLRTVVADMHAAAEHAGVRVVTGDTKVVPRGHGDGVYITTAGVGIIPEDRQVGAQLAQMGDRIICSGPIADHGMAVMMARGDLAIQAPIESDTRAINHGVEALWKASPHTRWLRDATRGGVATVMNEFARLSGYGVALEDRYIPVRDMTRAACDMLGIDPLYVANEGTFLAVVPEEETSAGIAALNASGFPDACTIGRVVESPASQVVLITGFGGTRMVDMLVGDPLPRIC
ncbi:hydrogenase expression/formation protein HypE [Corynebacterium poyangense]|uniref:Hydrogenase expression/formation protein HypE n=1 Tax=Corynebacterium poyangense TaxID=2684405 RepID=A0A7H0SR52_9CORY|nr:hydrogenase expression/formation protein HypE [Corynebacterium poyangense]QNQ91027.1 hydrogenase expression/formation protein HypE [Corynebacterium poyangense]